MKSFLTNLITYIIALILTPIIIVYAVVLFILSKKFRKACKSFGEYDM